MSFWPLAKTLTEELHNAAAHGPLVEVGCGSGAFARRLAQSGFDVIALDHDLPSLRTFHELSPGRMMIRARGESLPFPNGSLGGVLCANLLRNARDSWPTVRRGCHDALALEGALVILEDDAEDDHPAARNYRETLRLLSVVNPSRGSALRAEQIESLCEPAFGRPVAAGTAQNEVPVEDPAAPLRWLASRELTAELRRELRRIEKSVGRHGMAYGRYLYRIYRKGDACDA